MPDTKVDVDLIKIKIGIATDQITNCKNSIAGKPADRSNSVDWYQKRIVELIAEIEDLKKQLPAV